MSRDQKQKVVYQEIQDDQYAQNYKQNTQTYHPESNQINQLSNEQKIPQYQSKYQQQQIKLEEEEDNTKQERRKTQSPVKQKQNANIDQQDLGKYANLQEFNQDGQNIAISIQKVQKRGGILSAYFVYFIQGHDSKGVFNAARRFNQFYQMRAAMIGRWPGCFVPSIPAKNAFQKNDNQIIKKRMRYLNDFVKQIAKLPHLYYGEQFQTLLRANQADISQVFASWPTIKSEEIINKYRFNFSQLAGKELNNDTNEKINDFSQLLKKNHTQLHDSGALMRKLAESQDKLIQSYTSFFSTVIPTYEKQCLSEYCDKKEQKMLYFNESEIKLQEHQTISKQAFKGNPFWSLYDMIKHQQRDCEAFLEALQAKAKYQHKNHITQIKISENQKTISELAMGKKPFSLGSKGTSQEMKYKIQMQVQQLKRQKQNFLIIIDIITALITYIEIQRYKQQKKQFYIKSLQKIGTNQISEVQNLGEIWNGLKQSCQNKANS